MQVRGFVFDGATEKIVNANCPVVVSSARIRLTCDVNIRNRGGQERRSVRLRGSHLNERTVFGDWCLVTRDWRSVTADSCCGGGRGPSRVNKPRPYRVFGGVVASVTTGSGFL